MKGTAIVAAALMAAASTVSAQDAPARTDTAAIRDQIKMMEYMLSAAVRTGAQALGRRLQSEAPGSLLVTSDARARGFVLEGYGVFFDVDVPTMRQSVAWTMRMLMQQRELALQQRQNEIARVRELMANTPDGPRRRALAAQLQQLEGAQGAAPSPVSQAAPPGMVTGATVAEPSAADAPAPAADTTDPNVLYTDAVKSALIDAMLDYSGRLEIGDNEWLTVAARDSEGPLIPNSLEETSTIVLRVKGSDLVAYRTNRLTREEARNKVEVREF